MERCVLIIPALEPRKDFGDFVDELLQLNIGPIVVVDDGSGKKYRNQFRAINAKENCFVIYHESNYGKGAAIKTGIKWSMDHFFSFKGVITVDCDGQHLAKDVKAVYDKLITLDDDNLVLGVRAFDSEDTPRMNLNGNRLASKMMQMIYGIELRDTQTGLRGFTYPSLEWLLSVGGDGYDYELNVLIESKKRSINFNLVDVETIYFRRNADSHYRPFMDSLRIAKIMVKGLVHYFASSLTSTGVDLILFTLLTKFFFSHMHLSVRIMLATIIARVFSSIINYSINKRLVFSQDTSMESMVRYYTVWGCQVCVSILLVMTFTHLLGIDEVFIKMGVDACLALISYQLQLRWVFKDPNHEIRK
ncbi:MAG: bifunctional glycosyltransferase family 2/GtrA family protein [Firmicutes bacterium]|nr:bifunctional glycosyltransferase family 2/GtrA family protein [Bacillota bacterium]